MSPYLVSFFSHCLADAISSQLNSVRLKLEQRRRRIEEEKRKMEQIMARQREKVGQGNWNCVLRKIRNYCLKNTTMN